jgi:protein tyrosine phosphatase
MANEWRNWEQVTQHLKEGHKLYRSSSPNYQGYDESQTLTPTAVKFLTDNNIDSIISFNRQPYNAAEKGLLESANIKYIHLPVQDFTPPTIEQLMEAIAFFNNPELAPSSGTLVHCGYGMGRTGTAVTAMQLDATGGMEPDESVWQSENHVERSTQMAVLREFKAKLKGEF